MGSRTYVATTTMRPSEETVTMTFVVIPIGSNPRFGFWLRAKDAAEARRLVSLNVPNMLGVIDPSLAQCNRDDSHAPMHGVIFEGSGRLYPKTRRAAWPPADPVLP
jgi:hypothetical protein